MADIAKLGIQIDVNGAQKAKMALDGLRDGSVTATRETKRLTTSAIELSGVYSRLDRIIDLSSKGQGQFGSAMAQVTAQLSSQSAIMQALASEMSELPARMSATAAASEEVTRAATKQNSIFDQLSAGTTRLTKVTGEYSSTYAQLRASVDPAYRASREYKKATEILDAELKRGTITLSEYNRTLQMVGATTSKGRGLFKLQTGAIQQAGYQIGDFAVQVGSGQSALVAFTQQASQMAQIFGPGGAVVGAVLAIGGAIAGSFLRGTEQAADSTEKLIDKIKGLEKAYRDLSSAQRTSLLLERDAEIAPIEDNIRRQRVELEKFQKVVDDFVSGRRGESVGSVATGSILGIEGGIISITPERYEEARKKVVQLSASINTLEDQAKSTRDAYDGLAFGFDESAEAAKSAKDEVDSMVSSLQDQASAIGETARQTSLRVAAENNATDAQLAAINASYDAIEAEERRKAALEESRKATRQQELETARLAREQERAAEQYQNWTQSVTDSIDPMAAAERKISEIMTAFKEGDLGAVSESQVKEYVSSLRKAAEKATEEFKNPWQSVAKEVSGSLQDAIVSGDWDSIGDSIGAALGASVSAVVSKSITDELAKGMTESSGALAQIGAAFAGPIAGAIAGGIVQRLITELNDEGIDPTAQRQAEQGTGGVLGSIDAKSESIRRGIDTISSTNEQLVNINTGMLAALESTLANISDAVTLAIRGRGGQGVTVADRGAFGVGADDRNRVAGLGPAGFILDEAVRAIPVLGDLVGDLVDGAIGIVDDVTGGAISGIGKAVFGSKKVVDEGVKIIGGTVAELVQNTVAEGFVTIRKSGSLFGGSGYTKDFATQQLVTDQFTLIFQSLRESIVAGADALGLLPGEIQSRLDAFVVETQRISLEDLNAEEQAAAIESVISDIFDDLVGASVPFVERFQDAGETLGQTLTRLGAQTQLTKEGFAALGVALEITDPERLAGYADVLVNAAGGIESFSNALVSFESSFLTEVEQFDNTSRRLSEAMGDLPLPETRQGFADLLKAQLAAAEGNEQAVATLLRLSPLADEYYQHLEDGAEEAAKSAEAAAARMIDAISGRTDAAFSALQRSIQAERDSLQEEYDARMNANRLAVSAVQDGIREIESELRGIQTARGSLSESFAPGLDSRRQNALNTLAMAIETGDLTGASEAAGIAASVDESAFRTREAFEREQAKALILLSTLEDSGEDQLTTAERSLKALESQASAIQRGFDAESERLDSIIEDAQSQIDAIRGVDNSVMSVVDAIDRLASVLSVERSTAVTQAYDAAGATADAEGRKYWESAISQGQATTADLEFALWVANEENRRWWESQTGMTVPGFANGGTHMGGIRMVGERGPEIEMTGASRIISYADLMGALGSNQEMVREMRSLHTDIMRGLNAVAKNTDKSAKKLDRWDLTGLPEERTTV